jgi:hypothetical protein
MSMKAFGLSQGLLELSRVIAEGAVEPADLTRYALDFTCAVVPGSRWASVTRLDAGQPGARTLAANDPRAAAVDACQYEADEGPCLAAIAEDRVVVSDFGTETRWPAFLSRVRSGHDCCASISYPLSSAGHARTSLNVYSDTSGAFGEDATDEIAAAAAGLSMALTGVQHLHERENLQIALQTNRRIGAAIGILMTREGLTYDQAFVAMRGASQRRHRKLRDVAEEVLYTGTTG